MKVVYKAPDEFMSITIKSLLESEGMEVFVKSYQISMFDNVAQMMKPCWGELLVPDEDYDRATKIIDEYLKEERDE